MNNEDFFFIAIIVIIIMIATNSALKKQVPKCTQGHKWEYNKEGNMICSKCFKVPLSD